MSSRERDVTRRARHLLDPGRQDVNHIRLRPLANAPRASVTGLFTLTRAGSAAERPVSVQRLVK
jgi:hypothetical protein